MRLGVLVLTAALVAGTMPATAQDSRRVYEPGYRRRFPSGARQRSQAVLHPGSPAREDRGLRSNDGRRA